MVDFLVSAIQSYELNDYYSDLDMSLNRYYALEHTSDFCADINMNFTHSNITDFLCEEKGPIIQKYNFLKREVKCKIEIEIHELHQYNYSRDYIES
jgi:hypothetical protein